MRDCFKPSVSNGHQGDEVLADWPSAFFAREIARVGELFFAFECSEPPRSSGNCADFAPVVKWVAACERLSDCGGSENAGYAGLSCCGQLRAQSKDELVAG